MVNTTLSNQPLCLYDEHMVAVRGGPNFFELDERARAPFAPHPVISADGPNPREIDDAISVTPLPSSVEMYKVNVCIANTARLYNRPPILSQALRKTESTYWTNADGSAGYDPMIDPLEIRKREFKRDNRSSQTLKSGVIFSFTVGESSPPDDLSIKFGMVRVEQNLTYKRLGQKCKYSPKFEAYARAAAFIIHHLDFAPSAQGAPLFDQGESADATYNSLIGEVYGKGPLTEAASTIVAANMVATNYLTTRLLDSHGFPIIHRIHRPATHHGAPSAVLRPAIAYYSLEPGPHDGLGLPTYARFTSPLRRLEDFIGIHLLKVYSRNKRPDSRDLLLLDAAVQRLNQRVATAQFKKPLDVRRAILQQKEDRTANRIAALHEEVISSAVA